MRQPIEQVNEKSTAYLTATFKDKAGVAQAPALAHYRIDDVESGQTVRGETEITAPGAVVELVLTVVDNTLVNQAAKHELRRVTVVGEYGAGDAVTAEYIYDVVNLKGVS
jgi:hypothetical protein